MSRQLSVASSHLRHGRSVARTLRAVAVAAGLTLVAGCATDLTAPDDARPTVAGAKAFLAIGGAQTWNGRIVSFMNLRPNSANPGQAVCLDIPWGVAFSGQDVNYFPCHFGPAQQFVLTAWDAPNGGSWVMIRPVSSSAVCFDMRGGTINGGEHLQLFTCKVQNGPGSANQTFKLPPAMAAPMGGGLLITTVCPQAGYPNLAVEMPLPAAVSSFVQQLGWTGASNQLWMIRDVQTGAFFRTADAAGSIWRTC
jgi:hypothetical protein